MVNPIALSYAKLKQFHNNPQYNPGMEAVYNRAMSAPVAPNIGGEIIRNILGAYVGSKLGEGKQNYLESQQEQERQRRLTDERSMLDYRVGLENQQKEAERERLYQGLLGMGSPESFSPTGEQWASPAPVKGVPAGMTADFYSKMAERKFLPEKQKSAYEIGQVLSPIDVGDKTITYQVTGIDSNNKPILSVIGTGNRYKPAQPAKPEKDTTDKDFSSWMKQLSDTEFGGGDTEGITNYIKNKFPAEWAKTQAKPEVKNLFGGGNAATPPQPAATGERPSLESLDESSPVIPQSPVPVKKEPTELDLLKSRKQELIREQKWIYPNPEVIKISKRIKELNLPPPKTKEQQITELQGRLKRLKPQLLFGHNKEYKDIEKKLKELQGD